MRRCRDGWPSAVLVACLAVITVSTALAQPSRSTVRVGKPTILAPQKIDLSKLVIPSIVSESNLGNSLLWGRPQAHSHLGCALLRQGPEHLQLDARHVPWS